MILVALGPDELHAARDLRIDLVEGLDHDLGLAAGKGASPRSDEKRIACSTRVGGSQALGRVPARSSRANSSRIVRARTSPSAS